MIGCFNSKQKLYFVDHFFLLLPVQFHRRGLATNKASSLYLYKYYFNFCYSFLCSRKYNSCFEPLYGSRYVFFHQMIVCFSLFFCLVYSIENVRILYLYRKKISILYYFIVFFIIFFELVIWVLENVVKYLKKYSKIL